MWELDYMQKNWCFWIVLEKTFESPLDCKEIQPVLPKGDQSWVFVGRTDVEAETPILWSPEAKSWLIWKDLDAGKDWTQEESRTTEDEMVGWHHRLNGHEFEQAPGDGEGQGSLVCYRPWGHKELDMTAQTEHQPTQLQVILPEIHVGKSLFLRAWLQAHQLCLTLYDPMDCSLPGSSVHGLHLHVNLVASVPWTRKDLGGQHRQRWGSSSGVDLLDGTRWR